MRKVGLIAMIWVMAACNPVEERVVVHAPEPKPKPAPAIKVTQDFAVPVLMYHRICDLTTREKRSPLTRDLTVSPADFEAQVKYLHDNGYTFLFADEVQEAVSQGTPLPVKGIALTMDDGYRDNFEVAYPILQKYGAKATIFMVTNNFGKPERLTWLDVKTMQQGKVSFGSHTVSHLDLTTLPDLGLKFELAESKRTLETGLATRIQSIAYPAGAFNPRVIRAVSAAGYRAGWKKGGGPVGPWCSGEMFKLPRVRVHGRTTMDDFVRTVTSGIWARRMRVAASVPTRAQTPSRL